MPWKEMQAEYQTYLDNRAGLAKARSEADAEQADAAEMAARTAAIAEIDRFMLNRILFDVAGSLDSLSYAYRQILEMQREKAKPTQPGPARR